MPARAHKDPVFGTKGPALSQHGFRTMRKRRPSRSDPTLPCRVKAHNVSTSRATDVVGGFPCGSRSASAAARRESSGHFGREIERSQSVRIGTESLVAYLGGASTFPTADANSSSCDHDHVERPAAVARSQQGLSIRTADTRSFRPGRASPDDQRRVARATVQSSRCKSARSRPQKGRRTERLGGG
jgi:hypothetical protein